MSRLIAFQSASVALILVAGFTAGCHSDGSRHGYSVPRVSDESLVNVPESDRSEIAKTREEWNGFRDQVSVAERKVAQEKDLRGVAKAEHDVGEAEERAALKALEAAREGPTDVRDRDIEAANAKVEAARAHKHAADSKIAYHDAHIDQLQAEVTLAKKRVDLAEARLELAKARAVGKLDAPSAQRIVLGDFEAFVQEREAEVAMAEVEVDAWAKKVKIRQDVLDARSDARAASFDKRD